MRWQKIVYGATFVVVLPLLLFAWAAAARVSLPVYGNVPLGTAVAGAGLALVSVAMFELERVGGGLPMNAFPPPTMVSQGAFQLLPHPIYCGFVAVCLGVSMMLRSASGLWLISPVVALGCVALVLGYERPDLLARFGRTLEVLPAAADEPPSAVERLRFILLVIVPWLALYEFTIRMRLHGLNFGFPFEERLPTWPWTAPVYESTYVLVALAPWLARTRRDLRRLAISAWVAMAVVFPIYWLLPSGAPRRPLPTGGWPSALLGFERTTYPPVAALPSFHVLWTILVARLFRRRWIGWACSLAVAASCVTTGMHYVADVVAAFVLSPVILEPERPWETARRAAERLANSWHEWRLGPVRFINHGLYAGAAALVQTSVLFAAAGRGREWAGLAIALAGLIGAGLWAQLVEGSSRLRRPFGFYGGLIGVGVACLLFHDRWTLLGASCLAAPWMQAIGRLRCLVNGCCHGHRTSAAIGIRVTNPRSRVTRLADLAGVPVHATQLYSILANVMLGLLVGRLWVSGCPLALVCGVYCLGNGLARFVEEAYRGEPQTPVTAGLRLYQWLAIATVLLGAMVTVLDSPPPPALPLTLAQAALAAAFACLAGAAMGVDFPEKDAAFARLT